MNVTGDIKPCQRPFQNPEISPLSFAFFIIGFGPARQAVKERITIKIIDKT